MAYEHIATPVLKECVAILKSNSGDSNYLDYPSIGRGQLEEKLENALRKEFYGYLRIWYHLDDRGKVDVTAFFQKMKEQSQITGRDWWAVCLGFRESLFPDDASDDVYRDFLAALERIPGTMGAGTPAGSLPEFTVNILRVDAVYSVDVYSPESNPDGRKLGRLGRVARQYYDGSTPRRWYISQYTDRYFHPHWGKGRRCEIWTNQLTTDVRPG